MRLLSLLLALVASVCFAAEPNLSERLQANTVLLADGGGHGSGVLFTRGEATFIWTAGHVADHWVNRDGTYDLVPVFQGELRGQARVIRVGDYEAGVDIALLEVVTHPASGPFVGTSIFYRGFNEVRVGQKVVHCGTPYDRVWNERLISYGRMASVNRIVEGRPILAPRAIDQVDITAYAGCSGGPVIDEATEGIVGLLVMGSAPRLAIIEPTRHIYQWAKEHDCLWAFDRCVGLPETILAWPSDRHLRQVKDRYCPEDDGWGELPADPVEPEVVKPPTLDEIIDAVLDAIREEEDEEETEEETEEPELAPEEGVEEGEGPFAVPPLGVKGPA